MFGKQRSMIMTEGVIWKQLIHLSIPLLIGNLFQQLYNTVGTIVVGKYVGKEALAAVGVTGPISNTVIGFFMGLAAGGSVVISQYFGARDYRNLRTAVQTIFLMTFALSVLLTGIGVLVVPFMLRFMKTPADVIPQATVYLRIYFAGVSGLMVYNVGAGVLQAVGDTRRPLYFLCISSVLNIVLCLLFVGGLGWGIAGAAYATIICQFVSAGLVLFVLSQGSEPYTLVWRKMRVSYPVLKAIFRVGFPAGAQAAITSFSNVFVQSYINAFGSSCMAGWTAYGKVDQFALLPMQSLALASTTFVGQNRGAGLMARAKQGVRTSLTLSVSLTAVLTIAVNIFAGGLLRLFNSDPQVMEYGILFVRFISPFYVLCCVNQVLAGALRGAGDARTPMLMMVGCFVVFRQLYLFVVTRITAAFIPVTLAYPMGWILCSLLMYLYYRTGKWEHRAPLTGAAAKTAQEEPQG